MISVQVNILDIEDLISRKIPQNIGIGFDIIAAEFRQGLALSIVRQIFEAVMGRLDNETFHFRYKDQLMENLVFLPIQVIPSNDRVTIVINLDALGTKEDLDLSVHYLAAIEDGGFVESLPYAHQKLKNTQEMREEWLADHFAGVIDVTIQERFEFWGKKSPQWLILEYGTTHIYPIPAFHVQELIETELITVGQNLLLNIQEQMVQNADEKQFPTPITGLKFDPRLGTTGRFRGALGRITSLKAPYDF